MIRVRLPWVPLWRLEAHAATCRQRIRDAREQQRLVNAAKRHNDRVTDQILRDLEAE
jgi:8-oxo-dGTP pyrophosphatase MutT (NUDIX family)